MPSIQILMLSHGSLAKEMFETAKLIMGDSPNVRYLILPAGANLDEYQGQIRTEIESAKDGILILIDLFGGTPFMMTSRVLSKMDDWSQVEVVTGMNLPMVLEVVSKCSELPLKEIKQLAVMSGTRGVMDLRTSLAETGPKGGE